MSGTTFIAALALAIAVLPDLAAGQARKEGQSTARQAFQEHDRITGATFTATTDAGGNAVVAIRGGEFTLEKVVSPSGDATIRLSQGRDVITIAVNQNGFHVGRGRRIVRFDPRSESIDKLDAIRSLLVGSQAVRSFKRLAASLEDRDEAEEDGALAVVALVDGAIVQLLDGDTDAPRRIARRLTRKHRAALRVVTAKRAPDVFRDCIGVYQFSLMDAYSSFQTCWVESTDYSWWSRNWVIKLCEWEWALRSQQYVWQFIGCFMLPI
jgi:hypothetical protein